MRGDRPQSLRLERVGIGLDDYRDELLGLVPGPRATYPSARGLPVVEALDRVLAADVVAAGGDGPATDGGNAGPVGDPVARAGRRIDPALAAALLAAGIAAVPVWLPPRVAVVGVTDDPAGPGAPGAGTPSGGPAGGLLGIRLRRLGVRPVVEYAASGRVGPVLDRLVANGHDLVVLAGGPTDVDAVGPVPWARRVTDGGFRAVRLSPGGRQGWLRRGGALVLCVPGDPVAASLTFDLLIRPVVLRLAGVAAEHADHGGMHGLRAVADVGWTSLRGVREVVPVRLRVDSDGVLLCTPVGEPDLPRVADLADADALALVPEEVAAVSPEMPLRLWALTR